MKTRPVTTAVGILCLVAAVIFTHAGGTAAGDTPLGENEIRECYLSSYRAQTYEEAIKAVLPLKDLPAQRYLANLRLGYLYYLNGKLADAKLHYQTAIKAAPEALEPKLGCMLPLLAQGKWDEIETLAQQVLRIDPNNYYANLRLAFTFRLEKKYQQADTLASRMLQLYPTDTLFMVELALTKQALNQKEAAKKLFSDLLNLDPENFIAKQQLGKQ